MSNLKKVLSLSVVFIMVFALMATAGAAFGDADDIEFVDEANLLSSLEIIKGDLSGNFLPQADVYRNQMAKMIYVAFNKGIDNGAPLYASLDVPLKDIDNDWAKNYIKFVHNMGIISGSPTGYFFGSNKVTGFEAAKMMLTMLGYKADVEGYVGANWKNNVARDAMLAGILDGLEDIDLGKNLTKEEAAKMIYNTIFTEMVKYVDGVAEGTGKDFAEAKLALQTETGILLATDVASLDGAPVAKGKIKVSGVNGGNPITGSASIDDLGKEVTVYVRMKTDGVTIDKAYGSAVATSKNVVKIVYNGNDKLNKVAGAYDTNLFTGIDGVEYSSAYGAVAVADATALDVNLGDKVIFISNDDDKVVEYVIHVPYNFGKVAVRSTVNGNVVDIGAIYTSLKPAEILGFSGIEAGDYVIAYAITGGTTYKHAVVKATSLEGKITAANTGKTQFLIGSKWYNVSAYTGASDFATDFATIANKDATFYVDASGRLVGYVLPTAPVETPSGKYAFVIDSQNKVAGDDFGAGAKDPMVVVMNEAGKKVTYKVAKAYKANGDAIALATDAGGADLEDYTENKLFSYSLNDAGEITLKEVAGSVAEETVGAYTAGSSLLKLNGINYVISDDTVIFFYNKGTNTWSIKKGKSILPDFNGGALVDGTVLFDAATNGVLNAIYLNFTATPPADATETVKYAVVTGVSIMVDADGNFYAAVELFDGKNEPTVINTTSAATIAGIPGDADTVEIGDYVTYDLTSGKISDLTKKTRTEIGAAPSAGTAYGGYIKAINGAFIDVVKNDGTLVNRFKLANNAIIATVDTKNAVYTPASALTVDYVAGYADKTGKTILFFNTSGDVVAAFQRTDAVYTLA